MGKGEGHLGLPHDFCAREAAIQTDELNARGQGCDPGLVSLAAALFQPGVIVTTGPGDEVAVDLVHRPSRLEGRLTVTRFLALKQALVACAPVRREKNHVAEAGNQRITPPAHRAGKDVTRLAFHGDPKVGEA